MTGNVLTNDFYHNMLEAKCSVLKDLIQNKEACDRYERLSHITNKIETIGGTRWVKSIKTMEVQLCKTYYVTGDSWNIDIRLTSLL